jgi:PAS domain S-box-containing protein
MVSNEPGKGLAPDSGLVRSTLNIAGTKYIRGRLIAGVVVTAALLNVVAFCSAYFGFAGGGTATNLLTALVGAAGLATLAGVSVFEVARRLSSNLQHRINQLTITAQLAAGGSLTARVESGIDDEFKALASALNAVLDRTGETVRSEVGQKQALLAIVKAVESSSDAIAVADSSRTGFYFNRRFIELFEYTAEQLNDSGGTSLLFVDPNTANLVVHVVSRGDSWAGETDMRTRSGRVIPIGVRVDPIRDQAGNVTGRIEILTDITDRRKSERLNSALHRIAELATSGDDLYTFNSKVHRIVREQLNADNYSIAVLDPSSQMLSFPYHVDMREKSPSPRPLGRGIIEHVLRNGQPLVASIDLLSSMVGIGEIEISGAPPVSWMGVPLKNADEIIGVVSVQSYSDNVIYTERDVEVLAFVSQHITSAIDRKRADDALRISEEKYRTILESIEDGYYEVDLRGSLVFFNDAISRILGFPPEELLGLNHRKYIEQPVCGEIEKKFNTVYRTGQPVREYAYEMRRPDGVRRFLETSISLRRNAVTGQPEGFRGVLRDVTERRVVEESLGINMKEFLQIVSRVSEGDLTSRGSEGDDTLGQVVRSINKMLDNFTGMLTEVKQIGLSVSSNATEVLAASEQIAVGSQRQADEITNTSSGVEEMAASMSQVSKNAEASAEAARRAFELAELGDKSVRDTTEAMTRIDTAVQQTAEKMRLLGVRSSEISEIIDLIDEIAAQTNLLALNAAIEAAHAGEAGLGFSVVAEEIRKLAERSARATRDVGNLIKSIQSETREALSAMEIGMREVTGGSKLAGEAGRALQDISEAVRQSAELMEEISAASEEQARVTRNLAAAMQTISSITLETSAGAHETAQTIHGMVGLSEQLNKAISQFKVKNDFVHPFSYDLRASGERGGGSDLGHYSPGD